MSIASTMRAVIAAEPGGPEVLKLVERPVPVPGPGEVLIKVCAAWVNRPDLMQRRGAGPVPPGAGDVLGLEIAGEIVATGPGAVVNGTTVMALVSSGGYADYCVAVADHCLPVPPGIDPVQAAALPEALFTVWHNMFELGALGIGETVLIHGAASGVGSLAVQLAKAAGARVIATAGGPAKTDAVRRLGADRAVDYKACDFVQAVAEETGGRGVDVVLDIVGGSYVARNLAAMAPGGRHVSLSFMEASVVPIDLGIVMGKGLHLTSSTLRPKAREEKTRLARCVSKHLLPLVAGGRVKPLIWKTLPLAQARDAHEILEKNENIGKVVLVPDVTGQD